MSVCVQCRRGPPQPPWRQQRRNPLPAVPRSRAPLSPPVPQPQGLRVPGSQTQLVGDSVRSQDGLLLFLHWSALGLDPGLERWWEFPRQWAVGNAPSCLAEPGWYCHLWTVERVPGAFQALVSGPVPTLGSCAWASTLKLIEKYISDLQKCLSVFIRGITL